MSAWEPPDGYHFEWLPEGDDWTTDPAITLGRYCRYSTGNRTYCQKPAKVALNRGRGRDLWYGYCDNPEHMYGRRITNGVVEHRVLRPDEVPA